MIFTKFISDLNAEHYFFILYLKERGDDDVCNAIYIRFLTQMLQFAIIWILVPCSTSELEKSDQNPSSPYCGFSRLKLKIDLLLVTCSSWMMITETRLPPSMMAIMALPFGDIYCWHLFFLYHHRHHHSCCINGGHYGIDTYCWQGFP